MTIAEAVQASVALLERLDAASEVEALSQVVETILADCSIIADNLDPAALARLTEQGRDAQRFIAGVKSRLASTTIELTAPSRGRLTATINVPLTGSVWDFKLGPDATIAGFAHWCAIEIMEEITVCTQYDMD